MYAVCVSLDLKYIKDDIYKIVLIWLFNKFLLSFINVTPLNKTFDLYMSLLYQIFYIKS